ncbi:MAG: hypothetical protein KHX30_00735 [Clostridium sp.]|nr:hypothetical protein [Clostridium sp.]
MAEVSDCTRIFAICYFLLFLSQFVIKKVKRGQTLEQIADILEKIEAIYHVVTEAAPEYDLAKIQKRVSRKL